MDTQTQSRRVAWVIPLLLALGSSAVARAVDDHDGRDMKNIVVRVSESLFGRAIEVSGDKVIVEIAGRPGSRVGVPAELVPPDTLFEIEEIRMDPDDAESWRELEAFAAEHGLHLRRMEVLERIAELEPERSGEILQEIEECRESCAADRLGKARRLREAGELGRSMRTLRDTVVRYAGCVSAIEARSLIEEVESDMQAERERAWEITRKRRALRAANKELEEIAELIEEGHELVAQARSQLDEYVKATHALLKADGRFASALKKLDRLPDYREMRSDILADEQGSLATEQDNLRLVAEDSIFEVHIELGHMYIARGDQSSAYKHAGMAAGIDPNDWRVVSLRSAIAGSR